MPYPICCVAKKLVVRAKVSARFCRQTTEILKPMLSMTAYSSASSEFLKNSSVYREFQAEREEILKHKWIESEKAGHDIGFERALTDWIVKHRTKWRKARQANIQSN